MPPDDTSSSAPIDGPSTQPPAPFRLPPIPRGYRRLSLYSRLWRAHPGDCIEGWILGQQPIETPSGLEIHAAMLQITASCSAWEFDEQAEDRLIEAKPVGKITPTDSSMVAVDVSDSPALARLLVFADQPELAQHVIIWSVPHESSHRPRYLVFLAEQPAERAKVDPVEMVKLEEARRAAAAAAQQAT
jgi:hypothetical protein